MNFSKNIVCLFLFFNYSVSQKGLDSIYPENLSEENFGILVEKIMVKSLLPFNCVTVICDLLYCPVFDKGWFGRFESLLSFIVIKVNETEDLLAPSKATKASILLAKKEGCQMYIIFVANGMQVARLLRFGDRYRVVNTRAKFILLFDNRLFEKSLFYIWKRIINVVFIREYGGVSGNDKKKRMPWFEITTVPFPSPITSVLVPRRLDIWTQGKFRSATDLFRDKTLDLRNQTLKVATFAHTPGTIKIEMPETKTTKTLLGNGSFTFTGTEIEILQTVSKVMNFRCDIYEPDNANIEMWGRKDSGAKFTGLIGEMVYNKADLALGDLYYMPYLLNLMDLSTPYNTECLTFLTPEDLTDNSWKTLILPFKPPMWAGVIVCLIFCGIVFNLLARFHCYIESSEEPPEVIHVKKKKVITLSIFPEADKLDIDTKYAMMKGQYQPPAEEGQAVGLYQFTEPFNSMLYTYSMLLLVSLPKLPTGWSLRVLTGWYWLYCLLLVVAYRASLTAILANPASSVTIDTLEELVASRLTFGGWGEINREFFKSSPDPATRAIGENFEIVNNSNDVVNRVAAGKFAFYENTYFLKEMQIKRQLGLQNEKLNSSNETNANSKSVMPQKGHHLHIMNDCIIKMPISLGLQKNSPMKPRVDKCIRRVLEAGLIRKWLDDAMHGTLIAEKQTTKRTEIKALMDMKKYFGSLVALFIGYIISTIALIVEVVYFNFIIKKNPNFDKYSRKIKEIKKSD